MYFCFLVAPCRAAEFPQFESQVIDSNVGEVCYALALADVDGDDRTDIVAVTENRVLWYQNPDWKLRVISQDQTARDNVCIAAHDIDGDGSIDFALGAGWTRVGTLQWLGRGQSLDEPWNVYEIGVERWLHRVRWGDVLGTGQAQLIVSPLNRTQGDGVRLLAFEIPQDPRSGPWNSIVLDQSMNRMHNHWMTDLNGDGRDEVITASREGVFLIERAVQDSWDKKKLANGFPGSEPDNSGAGEVKVGKLSNGQTVIATIEPMHGTSAVAYTAPPSGQELWTRTVLDDSLQRGHAVWLADLDRDGSDEIIVGHSEKGTGSIAGPGVYIYDSGESGWQKHVLDNGGIAVEDIVATDLNGDGWIDIIAGGRDTHNIKLYLNLGFR
ncbi:MAG: FG-GAP repeat domain-containing protein [Acidobacteriota bacterium]